MNNRNKHTPGPWIVSDETRENFVWILDENSDTGVCMVHTDTDSKDESDANARLIAAAPELLEALESMLDYLKRQAKENSRREWALHNAHAEFMRNAIAKATGGAE